MAHSPRGFHRNLAFAALALFILCSKTAAQQFWLTTYEFPGGPKTAIAYTPDSCLLVGVTDGILRSCDEGNHFDSVLVASGIYSIFSNAAGKVFAGGEGQIFATEDNGQTWDSVHLNTTYPIRQILENSQGHLFAITGALTMNGFEGDGIFFSGDNGQTWMQRNNGLGIYTSIEHIAIDKNDRLYLAAADEYVTGNGGLFISDNNGQSWQHIAIRIDGQGAIPDEIKIANTWALSVSPDDSLHFSFAGTAVNTSVRLNIVKHINQVQNSTFWRVYNVGNSSTWWLDRLLNPLHFARNGDTYSSVSGSTGFGGTYFRPHSQSVWQKINYGLGVDIFGTQNIQHFTETPSGKIFMVQYLDERVYYTDTSRVTPVAEPENPLDQLTVFPNPVQRNETLFLQAGTESETLSVQWIDPLGRVVSAPTGYAGNLPIHVPEQPGTYFLLLKNVEHQSVKKIIVY